jgi:hypothetical protein
MIPWATDLSNNEIIKGNRNSIPLFEGTTVNIFVHP